MNIVTVGVGSFLMIYGVFSCALRFIRPTMFKKLEVMKNRFGMLVGNIIHFSAYVILPIVGGLYIIIAGLKGFSFVAI